MLRFHWTHSCAAVLAGLALAIPPALPAAGHDCQDVKASAVDAKNQSSGSKRCGFGLKLLGKGFGIFGPKCPTHRFIYPAHPACLGEAHPGTNCTVGEKLAVQMQTCDCTVLGVLDTGIGLPGCSCKDAGSNGYVETGKTVECKSGN